MQEEVEKQKDNSEEFIQSENKESIQEQSSEDTPQAPADNPTDSELGVKELQEEEVQE